MKTYDFEQLIRDELQSSEEISQILGIDGIPITPMDIHMRELEKHLQGKNTARSSVKFRIVMAFSIILLSLFMTLVWNTEPVKAFRFNIVKTYVEIKDHVISITSSKGGSEDSANNEVVYTDDTIEQYFSFEEAKRKIPWDYIQAGYIPQGFTPKEVQWNQYLSGSQLVMQTYVGDDNKGISIMQKLDRSLESKSTLNIPRDARLKEMTIEGKELLLIKIEENFTHAMWMDANYAYEILGNIPEDEMIKIVKSLN